MGFAVSRSATKTVTSQVAAWAGRVEPEYQGTHWINDVPGWSLWIFYALLTSTCRTLYRQTDTSQLTILIYQVWYGVSQASFTRLVRCAHKLVLTVQLLGRKYLECTMRLRRDGKWVRQHIPKKKSNILLSPCTCFLEGISSEGRCKCGFFRPAN